MRQRQRRMWMGAFVLYTALVYALLVTMASRHGLLPEAVSDAVESAVPESGLASSWMIGGMLP